MPYVITTKTPFETHGIRERSVDRRAVATLDEAREHCANEARDRLPDTGFRRWMHTVEAAQALPESGGTVGPLPDGTVIEVERVDQFALGWAAGLIAADHPQLWREDRLIEAYNAAQS